MSMRGPSSDAALRRSHRSLRDFSLVGRKRSHDFILLGLRDSEVVERPSELCSDLVELIGGDVQLSMCLLQPEWCASRPRGAEHEGTTSNVAEPQRAHELQ